MNLPDWSFNKGVCRIEIDSWSTFQMVLERYFLDDYSFIYRGQRCASWSLLSTYDRFYLELAEAVNNHNPEDGIVFDEDHYILRFLEPFQELPTRNKLLGLHLEKFKSLCTGRRVAYFKELSDNQWWALGQHFGLKTPLLDWSFSPYVALYFALTESNISKEEQHSVWVLSTDNLSKVEKYNKLDLINIVKDAESDENDRLLTQSGLFSFSVSGQCIEQVASGLSYDETLKPFLYKIIIPNSFRDEFLRHLEYMNIHSNSLFPDIIGSAYASNRELEKIATNLIRRRTVEWGRKRLDSGSFESLNIPKNNV
ncbi:FRG domain-containing protein [Vibrio parahaemolyticus]|uniref:FRG domain-containing protein n=6 Tax=Vibrio parahaemolyticus TaxID=670 RepID=UPI00112025D4|nr:FRG domain-containing protein [Vibrio parahaemolyticus]EIO4564279.1 FRG domain-containing protein [Vibrio parahaemolyticus]EIO4614784.1 FRG domain-containing protein [Vibrio parahaemolyticus]ELA7847894.1 FRG domain-containing protein [Vibrio parahaemolyticus]ELA9311776.1 FRG domain-containing protein [Vibrio parahaemolyticus]MBE3981314.1 FRG domain-containing protein [Vibrio parahaemolyticus]